MDEWKNGEKPKKRPYIYFGDILANEYALDAQTGELIWKIKTDDHPNATRTATSAKFEDILFIPVSGLEVIPAFNNNYECCTFRGGPLAVEADTGKILWKKYSIPVPAKYSGTTSVGTRMFGPSGAPIWTSPNIDKKRRYVYIGTGENYSTPADDSSDAIIAYDIDTGEFVAAENHPGSLFESRDSNISFGFRKYLYNSKISRSSEKFRSSLAFGGSLSYDKSWSKTTYNSMDYSFFHKL